MPSETNASPARTTDGVEFIIGPDYADGLAVVRRVSQQENLRLVEALQAQGVITDEDRWPWYASLRARIEEKRGQTPLHVLACSALKASYRDRLSSSDGPSEIAFIHLKGTREVIHARMSARKDHYMPPTLLDSQFAILEETPDLISVSLDQTPEAIQSSILAAFS